ncbi:MAG: polysaccharide deacetylase family protein [Clostridia bacterium]|nr:polysaccharide deacetylase family protein [Clostridia bacterium]
MKFYLFGKKEITVIGLCTILTLTAIFAAAGGAVRATTASAASKKLLPIYSVGREENDKIVSLSFDAAWGNEDTEKLIEILAKYDVKATFFVVADWVDKYPESVKALSDAGHEVMNHSTTHPHMASLSEEKIRQEIETCNKKIETITGRSPLLFRAPYGEYCDSLINTLSDMKMYCIQWDVDSLDWKDLSAQEITNRVVPQVKSGSIVLFHNAALHTPEALPGIIEALQAKGYKIVPISENIYRDNYAIDHEGRQQPIAN